MRYYIECYRADGSQILGNLDGQASLNCRNYRRTAAYKRLLHIVGNPKWDGGKVAYAHITDRYGKVWEVVGGENKIGPTIAA